MPYDLDSRLVIGVASSALFDLTDSHAAFKGGITAYRDFQKAHEDVPLEPGVAFPFIQRLLGLNDIAPVGDPLVEVFVLSRNDPVTGLRVMSSLEHHALPITRAIFTEGQSPYPYMEELNMSLFLSGNRADVDAAMALGFPSGLVLGTAAVGTDPSIDRGHGELRVAFDFDGVLADDASEAVNQSEGLPAFQHLESTNKFTPHNPGPLHRFVQALSRIQRSEKAHAADDTDYVPRVRVSIVTARNAPAHARAVNTLREWKLIVNDAFFLGGVEKAKILRVLRPHIFFDDQHGHLDPVQHAVASVLVPYGVMNAAQDTVVEAVPDRPAEPLGVAGNL